MNLLEDKILQYAESHTTPESDLLQKINRETHSQILMPQMLSGHLQGRFLSFLSQLLRPDNVLEIGTYTGYATLCLAEGLAENGKITTIDINEELEDRVRGYIEEAGLEDKIDYIVGNAMNIIPGLASNLDLVFIDADKNNYPNYYNLVLEKLNKGGHIIADNVLWSGKVIDKSAKDEDTIAIREFNEMVQNDNRVENILLPIRDGLMVLRKK